MSAKTPATIDDAVAMIKQLALQNTKEFGQIQNQLTSIKVELQILKISHSSVEKHLNKQEKLLFNWKSNLFNKIDDEIAILNNRTVEIRKRLDKIDPVFAS